MYRQALVICGKTLGKDHPKYAISLSNLGKALFKQKKFFEAEELARQALEISESRLGKEHPQSKKLAKNLEKLLKEIKGK